MSLFSAPLLFNVPRPASFQIESIGRFVGAVGMLIFLTGVLIFMGLFLWGGLEWITSGGDKAKIETARGRIMQALVGLSIISLALAVVILAQEFFGITIIGDVTLPTAF